MGFSEDWKFLDSTSRQIDSYGTKVSGEVLSNGSLLFLSAQNVTLLML